MNILKVIKSNNFALWVAILSVIVQSFHSYTAFYKTSSLAGTAWGVAQAVLFAVVIDLAILFYTVRNRKDIALYAAFVMVIINSYYYYQHLGLSFQFAFGVFLSLIIPTSVYFYSEEIKEDDNNVTDNDLLAEQVYRNQQLERQIDHTELSNKKLQDHFITLEKKYEAAIKSNDKMRKHIESMPNPVGNYVVPEDKSLLNVSDEVAGPPKIISTTIDG